MRPGQRSRPHAEETGEQDDEDDQRHHDIGAIPLEREGDQREQQAGDGGRDQDHDAELDDGLAAAGARGSDDVPIRKFE